MNSLVSVIMAVYNGEKYIKESIESIINQTYKNIELLIINDGSSDLTPEIITEYSKSDKRIKLINNDKNRGLIYSLNRGIEEAKGYYIVRMDADDIAVLTRIEQQVEFMNSNSEIAMSGTAHNIFLDGKKFVRKDMSVPTVYEEIKAKSIFECCFVHPSVIIRSNIIKNNNYKYSEEYKHAEDFGLWAQIITKHKVSNINKVLLKYRLVKNSATRKANKDIKQRLEVFKRIYKVYLDQLGCSLSDSELDMHFEVAMVQNLVKVNYSIGDKRKHLERLCNEIQNDYVKEVCAVQFLKTCVYQGTFDDYKESIFMKYKNVKKSTFLKKKLVEKTKSHFKRYYK